MAIKAFPEVDVLVIGGGPAGCSTAITCAAAGLRVRLLDRAPTPLDRPGESLHHGIEPLLVRLGAADSVRSAGFLRHAGHRVSWDGPERFVAFGRDEHGPWRGFQATRSVLDALLIDRAAALGVEVVRPCRSGHPIVSQGRVLGVTLGLDRATSKYLVDATGSSRWLARELGLEVESQSSRLIARYGYAHGCCGALFDAPAMRAETDGWLWMARVGSDLYAWTRLAVYASSSQESPRTSAIAPGELKSLQPVGKTRGCDVSWRRATAVAGPGYFIAGDAAATLDPASSHGVLRALMSGMYAGHAIVQICADNATEQQMQSEYHTWISGQFDHDASRLRDLYRAAFPCADAWFNSPAVGTKNLNFAHGQ